MNTTGLALAMITLGSLVSGVRAESSVSLVPIPDGGIQPRAVVTPDGSIQVVYFKGEAGGGDLVHRVLGPGEASFGAAKRINSVPRSAVAAGTIRGAQIASGRDGLIHAVWNGARTRENDRPPLFYTNFTHDGTDTPEQRPVSGDWLMDGGGAVSADRKGGVFVFFHGADGHGEEGRRVFVRISRDDGRTFAPERVISPDGAGVCACCGMQALADGKGRIFVVYRNATQGGRRRDIATLFSPDGGETWRHSIVDPWEVNVCPMSSMCIAETGSGVIFAWERDGQIRLGRWDDGTETVSGIRPLPGAGAGRKHPAFGSDAGGNLLVAWTEGTGWNRGGKIAWRIFDRDRNPTNEAGTSAGLPPWGFVSVVRRASGFVILH